MDRGAWWATVHGVAKSRTRLSNDAQAYMQGKLLARGTWHIVALKKMLPVVYLLYNLISKVSGAKIPRLTAKESHRTGSWPSSFLGCHTHDVQVPLLLQECLFAHTFGTMLLILLSIPN